MKRHTDEKEGDGKRYRLDGPGGHCAERNGSDRESQSSHDFTYMWTLQNKINNSNDKIGNKLTETENILRATRQDAGWGRAKTGEGIRQREWIDTAQTPRCTVQHKENSPRRCMEGEQGYET